MNLLTASLLTAVATLLCSAYFIFRWKRRKLYEFAAQLEDPPDLPYLGILGKCVGKSLAEITDMLYQIFVSMGSLNKLWFGPILCVVLHDPSDIELTLNSPHCMQKPNFYNLLRIKKGLLTLPAETWRVHRKYLNPAFNTKIIRSFIPIFNENAKTMAQELEKNERKGIFNFFEFSTRCTLDMICSTSLGEKFNFQTDSVASTKYLALFRTYMELISVRCFNILHHIDWIYDLSSNSHKLRNVMGHIFTIVTDIIGKRKQKMVVKNKFDMQEDSATKEDYKKPVNYIDHLLHLSETKPEIFDDDAVIYETGLLLIAAYDTSATVTANIILLLAIHQDVQERVFAELNEFVPDPNAEIDYETLAKLEYLHRVILETMRLYPASAIIARETTQDQELASQKVTIPPGVMLTYSIYSLHRKPELWGPNAHLFDPDNFTQERINSRHTYAYIPFSRGPRNCIGYKYAMLSIKLMLINILRKYKFRTPYTMDTIVPKIDLTMKLAHPHSVSVERREIHQI